MDILDVCDPTPDGFRYILVIADYFSKCTQAFPIKKQMCGYCGGGVGGQNYIEIRYASRDT